MKLSQNRVGNWIFTGLILLQIATVLFLFTTWGKSDLIVLHKIAIFFLVGTIPSATAAILLGLVSNPKPPKAAGNRSSSDEQ